MVVITTSYVHNELITKYEMQFFLGKFLFQFSIKYCSFTSDMLEIMFRCNESDQWLVITEGSITLWFCSKLFNCFLFYCILIEFGDDKFNFFLFLMHATKQITQISPLEPKIRWSRNNSSKMIKMMGDKEIKYS